LNAPLSCDFSEAPPQLRLKAEVPRRTSANFIHGSQLYVWNGSALYDWTVRQWSWYRGLNVPPLHVPQEAILRRCLLTTHWHAGHSAIHFVDGATTERSQQREPLQSNSFALALHTLSCP
jgi:hypothetical protein